MSNYGLACMILDLVKKDFLPDITSGSSLERIASGTSSGNTGVSGDSSGSDYRGSVFPGKDDFGELIKCKLKPGGVVLKSLKKDELSQIEIVDKNGGDNIFFKYDNQEFDWNSGDGIGKGGYGEVKLFTLSDGKSVAIKKYPTWKFDKDKNKIITRVIDLSKRSNEGIILEKIDEKCGPEEGQGEECIRSCDIVPAHYIKSSSGRKVFLINTKLPQKNYSKSFNKGSWPMDKEYSFIAMEAMDGSLRDYAVEQKKELDKLESDDDKRILLDKIFVNVTKIILEVAKVLQCLSDKEYYYPDLKSDNVLYKCDGENIIIKMGDIGSLTEKEDLINGDYTRTYFDSQAPFRLSTRSHRRWILNPNYYHVYLLGYLYIDILGTIFGINFAQGGLKEYTKSQQATPNDEQIRTYINKFMGDIRKNFPPGYVFTGDYYYQIDCNRSEKNSCIVERFSVLIYDILHKTIVSQLELSPEGKEEIDKAKMIVDDLTNKKTAGNVRVNANRDLIKTKNKYSFRYENESELIEVLESFINKTNDDEKGEEY
jgi:serine/threonine protein kinase